MHILTTACTIPNSHVSHIIESLFSNLFFNAKYTSQILTVAAMSLLRDHACLSNNINALQKVLVEGNF